VALLLRERGYRASALLGGFDAWKAAGHPLAAVRQAG
jgi:rhodanese-related sulfurtransferase